MQRVLQQKTNPSEAGKKLTYLHDGPPKPRTVRVSLRPSPSTFLAISRQALRLLRAPTLRRGAVHPSTRIYSTADGELEKYRTVLVSQLTARSKHT